jgi:hypothetical protein
LEPAPISMGSTSARRVTPYQTLAFAESVTWPSTAAFGATQASS